MNINLLNKFTGRLKAGLRTGRLAAFSLIEIMVCIAIIGLLACLTLPKARADSQGYPQTYTALTNLPSIVNITTSSNQTSWIPLRMGRGLGLQWQFNTSSPGTNTLGNSGMWIWPSVDGTNAATVAPWVWTVAQTNGTTTTTAATNWTGDQLVGFSALLVSTMTNSSPTVTLTNKGVLSNIPNL